VLGLSAATGLAGEEWSQNVGTLTIKRTSTVGFGVTTETLEAIHFQVMTSNASVTQSNSSRPNTITYKSGRSEGATNNVEVLAHHGSAVTGGKESCVVFLALELVQYKQPHLPQVVNIHSPSNRAQNTVIVCSRVGLLNGWKIISEIKCGSSR